MDPEALPPALDRPLVRRAFEELKMLSQTDLERERYEARRKWQLDYASSQLSVAGDSCGGMAQAPLKPSFGAGDYVNKEGTSWQSFFRFVRSLARWIR
jgi:hypothetical protein